MFMIISDGNVFVFRILENVEIEISNNINTISKLKKKVLFHYKTGTFFFNSYLIIIL
jgi:hypothetical protein